MTPSPRYMLDRPDAWRIDLVVLVGEPATSYMTRWRMHLAAAALRDEGATVAAVADRLGYRSEAALARAFRRVMGSPPGAVRRAAPGETITG
jgi:AraC-like DNA-binding protein